MPFVRLSFLWLSLPLCGNGLCKLLDFGLRRNDDKGDSGLRRVAAGLLGGLFPTPLYHLGGLFPTPLYHLHPCRRASMQACPQMTTGVNIDLATIPRCPAPGYSYRMTTDLLRIYE